jgi:hypothetical protein
MFWEMIHAALEALNQHPRTFHSAGQVARSRVILSGSFITRSLLTLAAAWMIISCIVIALELSAVLSLWGLIATVAILFVNVFVLTAIWKFPYQGSRLLMPASLLLIGLSGIVFASVLPVKTLTREALVAVIFLVPAAIVNLLFCLMGRNYIRLTDWARTL